MCVSCRKNKGKVQSEFTPNGNGCVDKRTEIDMLNSRLLDIYSKGKDSLALDALKTVRIWALNILINCPEEDELEVMRKYVEDEYTKYFPTDV